jgi:hypothetical protein
LRGDNRCAIFAHGQGATSRRKPIPPVRNSNPNRRINTNHRMAAMAAKKKAKKKKTEKKSN